MGMYLAGLKGTMRSIGRTPVPVVDINSYHDRLKNSMGVPLEHPAPMVVTFTQASPGVGVAVENPTASIIWGTDGAQHSMLNFRHKSGLQIPIKGSYAKVTLNGCGADDVYTGGASISYGEVALPPVVQVSPMTLIPAGGSANITLDIPQFISALRVVSSGLELLQIFIQRIPAAVLVESYLLAAGSTDVWHSVGGRSSANNISPTDTVTVANLGVADVRVAIDAQLSL